METEARKFRRLQKNPDAGARRVATKRTVDITRSPAISNDSMDGGDLDNIFSDINNTVIDTESELGSPAPNQSLLFSSAKSSAVKRRNVFVAPPSPPAAADADQGDDAFDYGDDGGGDGGNDDDDNDNDDQDESTMVGDDDDLSKKRLSFGGALRTSLAPFEAAESPVSGASRVKSTPSASSSKLRRQSTSAAALSPPGPSMSSSSSSVAAAAAAAAVAKSAKPPLVPKAAAKRKQPSAPSGERSLKAILSPNQQGDDDGTRKSSRHRIPPVRAYKNEVPQYELRAGELLPGLKMAAPVSQVPPTPLPPQHAARKSSKKAKKGSKKGSKKDSAAAKGNASDATESDEEVPSKLRGPIKADFWMFDPATQQERYKVLAKTQDEIPFVVLTQIDASTKQSLPDKMCPRAGKAFDEEGFSSGLLSLPPGAVKQREVTQSCELFFVSSAATDSLEVTIGQKSFCVSKGDSFFVPGNTYYFLKNKSEKHSVKLFFVLVKAR